MIQQNGICYYGNAYHLKPSTDPEQIKIAACTLTLSTNKLYFVQENKNTSEYHQSSCLYLLMQNQWLHCNLVV
jgi:hypothetical protein